MAATEGKPTEIFLPEFHFPRDKCEVVVSGGKWSISNDDDMVGTGQGTGMIQVLRWWHGKGEQTIKVQGVPNRVMGVVGEEEAGYLEQCQQSRCRVM